MFYRFLLILVFITQPLLSQAVRIDSDSTQSPLMFGIHDLQEALAEQGYPVNPASADFTIRFVHFEPGMGPQGYRIEKEGSRGIRVTYGDAVGGMYAAFDLTEHLDRYGNFSTLQDYARKPYILRRGLKYNIPFDGRTPSYDDTGTAAQENIITMWDFNFWKHYLDNMARNRYNVLSLWTTNPYPGIVKLPQYPDVNFDDVGKATVPITPQASNHFNQYDLFAPENHEIILKISLEEKIAYWTKVFDYAESLGIEIYMFHWNIFNWNAQGKYGITREQDNPDMIAYQRYCIEQFLLTYPQIDGIGVSAGENVNRRRDWKIGIEDWLFQTYGLGLLDALEQDPDRPMRFIFRHLWSDLEKSARAFEGYNVPFNTSHKYARARLYSTTTSPYLDFEYRDKVEATDVPCWLNLRNDDLFILRWGNADYVREFLSNVPKDVMQHEAGFYMGSDSYVWGREFVSKVPELSGQWELDKHWYRYMLWGRLGYDLTLNRDYFEYRLSREYPELDPAQFYATWATASKIISWVDRFFFRINDAQFAPESNRSKWGFLTLDESYFKFPPLRGSGFLSVQDYAQAILNGSPLEGTTPPEVANAIDQLAAKALGGVMQLRSKAHILSDQTDSTLKDIESMAYLGQFYALRIRAAAQLAIYRQDPSIKSHHRQAVRYLVAAVDAWTSYADSMSIRYHDQLLSRTHYVDWNEILEEVRKEAEAIKNDGLTILSYDAFANL